MQLNVTNENVKDVKLAMGGYMKTWLFISTGFWISTALADNIVSHDIPMETQGSRTFYVQSTIHGSGKSMLLVDTGSGHSVINEETLVSLKSSGDAKFLKNLRGMMADGSTKIVPLYRISAITLGDGCVLNNVEAAVLPNNTRQILGISALQKAAPFGLSFDPPILKLSNCESLGIQAVTRKRPAPIKVPATIPVEAEHTTPEDIQAVASTG